MKYTLERRELKQYGYRFLERGLLRVHNTLLRHLSKLEPPSEMDVAVQYDNARMQYNLYHTITVLNGQETRALADFMETFGNAMYKEDAYEAADRLYEALGPYEFSPDVQEGEFGVPIVSR